MTTATIEKRVTKTEDRLDKIEQLILQQSINITKGQQETAELKAAMAESYKRTEQGFAELRASNAELRASITELRASNEESYKRTEQGFAELRKSRKQLDKKLGELSRRLGTIVEDIVAPSLEKIFLKVVNLPDESKPLINVRVKRKHSVTKEIREFDAIAECEEYLLVNETKSQLKPEDIPKFLDTLEEFYDYFPEHKDKGLVIIGAMSSLHLDKSLITALSKQGLLALAIGDTITTLKNPEGFKWRAF